MCKHGTTFKLAATFFILSTLKIARDRTQWQFSCSLTELIKPLSGTKRSQIRSFPAHNQSSNTTVRQLLDFPYYTRHALLIFDKFTARSFPVLSTFVNYHLPSRVFSSDLRGTRLSLLFFMKIPGLTCPTETRRFE